MKIIIAGSRGFHVGPKLYKYMDHFTKNLEKVEVLSGCAEGADTLGERWAREHDHKLHLYPADWVRRGRSAGYIRNEVMASEADALVAFWDGKSPGTKHMIDTATAKGLKVRVVRI